MNKADLKKLIIPNIPYLLFVWLFDKAAQAFRLSPGADLSEKLLSLGTGFSAAFSNAAPSLPYGLAYRYSGGGAYPADCLFQGQEREEVPERHGIRLCPLWCIILTVRKTMWTQEVCT